MTIERLALRVAASLAVGGIFVLVSAVFCWATAGDGEVAAVHSLHLVGGWILAVFGAVMMGTGLAIGMAVPSQQVDRPRPHTHPTGRSGQRQMSSVTGMVTRRRQVLTLVVYSSG